MHENAQPYTMSFRCPKCNGSVSSYSEINMFPKLNFFFEEVGVKAIANLVELRGRRDCIRCYTPSIITRIKYGKDI